MNNKVIVRFWEDELMYEEKIKIMTSNVCKNILPLSIIHRNGFLTGYYNTSGYKRLSECGQLTTQSILSIIEKIILGIEACRQFLIFPEEYVINLNTIYIDERFETIKFTYIPDYKKERVKRKLYRLFDSMKDMTTENGKIYLDKLMEISSKDNISYRRLRLLVSKLSQEAKKYSLS